MPIRPQHYSVALAGYLAICLGPFDRQALTAWAVGTHVGSTRHGRRRVKACPQSTLRIVIYGGVPAQSLANPEADTFGDLARRFQREKGRFVRRARTNQLQKVTRLCFAE
jgi:hypothetical protein